MLVAHAFLVPHHGMESNHLNDLVYGQGFHFAWESPPAFGDLVDYYLPGAPFKDSAASSGACLRP